MRQAGEGNTGMHGHKLPGTSNRLEQARHAGKQTRARKQHKQQHVLAGRPPQNQRQTRKQPKARRGVQWWGGAYIPESTARSRKLIIAGRAPSLVGCRNGPCEAPTSRMNMEDAREAQQASARLGNGQAVLSRGFCKRACERAMRQRQSGEQGALACATLRVRCAI